jgi:hypothetical protein
MSFLHAEKIQSLPNLIHSGDKWRLWQTMMPIVAQRYGDAPRGNLARCLSAFREPLGIAKSLPLFTRDVGAKIRTPPASSPKVEGVPQIVRPRSSRFRRCPGLLRVQRSARARRGQGAGQHGGLSRGGVSRVRWGVDSRRGAAAYALWASHVCMCEEGAGEREIDSSESEIHRSLRPACWVR